MVSLVQAFKLLIAASACALATADTEFSGRNLRASATGFESCPTAPAVPQDRRADKTKLKYATYNVEFLYLVGYGTLDCPGADCKWKTETAAQNHIKQVATMIRAIDADVVQLNEVEDCAVLRALISELQVLGDSTYKPYLVRGSDSATGQNSALITRVDPSTNLQRTEQSVKLPVAQSKCPSATGYSATKGVAKHFYTSFKVDGFSAPITVIGAHLLANPTNKARCFEREGQATVLASLAQQAVASGNHVILSGDLNDFSASVLDRNDNRPISNALGIMESKNFLNAASFANKTSRFTQWYDKNNDCKFLPTETSSLDHIIVSESLRRGVTNVAFRNDLYTASCSGVNSDHFPVTMTLTPF